MDERNEQNERILGVAELLSGLRAMIDEALPESLWVQGEVVGLKRSRPGHVYFDLIDPDQDPSRPDAKLPAALFASDRRRVEAQLADAGAEPLADGLQVRVQGRVSLYVARSQVQLVVRSIDPTFTLGRLEAARQQLLLRLAAEGVLTRQQAVALPVMPRRIALVTSATSAACADTLAELEASNLGWDVLLVDCAVQGAGADQAVAEALGAAGRSGAAIVLLVRGGGSRGDLATFDTEAVARAIGTSPVPVWTGIGHEIDRSVADEVAHTAHKTPTACAAALIALVQRDLDRAHHAWRGIERRSNRSLGIAGAELVQVSERIGRATERRLRVEDRRLVLAAQQVPALAGRRLTASARHLDGAAARLQASDPDRLLARGWSITTLADGSTLRSVEEATSGATIRTRLVDGTLTSTVLASAPADQEPDDASR